MSDNNEAIPAPTLSRVLVDNPYEVRRWCQRLICTEAQLRAAVSTVGACPEAVRTELQNADRRPYRGEVGVTPTR